MEKEDYQLINKAIKLIKLVLKAEECVEFFRALSNNKDSFYHIFYAESIGNLRPIFINIFEVEYLNKISRVLRIAHTITAWGSDGSCYGFSGERIHYQDIRAGLEFIMKQLDNYLSSEHKKQEEDKGEDKPAKILISHSTNDKVIVEAFIQLLESMNIPEDSIICSSVPPYNIKVNENIYEFLRKSFYDNLHVLFFLSEEYYQSVPSLNEMGACWLAQKSYTSIVMPGFSFDKIKGVIDSDIAGVDLNIHEDKSMLRTQLRELRDFLTELFSLEKMNEAKWERYADDFIKKLKDLNA